MPKFILSIDQGTTSCRAILFDQNGAAVSTQQKEFQQYFPKPGWVEHDAEEILSCQLECIKGAVAAANAQAEDIAAVGITNQRETTVVWNRKTGKPIYNAIVWQCRRTQDEAMEFRKFTKFFRDRTGLMPDAYFSGLKIKWILDNVKGARDLAERGELAFGTIDTWLIWNLTERKHHVTEPSNASRTMVFNINEMKWDREILEQLSIPASMMPNVIPSDGDFGTTSTALVGFNAPICGVLGDQQAALFGQTCFEPGLTKCTYGTGTFLLTNIGTHMKLVPGLLTTVAWQLGDKPATYALEGAVFVSGAAIQWLRDGLGIIESSKEAQSMAEQLESNDGVYFVPALAGLGSPWWDSDVRGTIVGLTRGTGRSHFVRAALEAMAYSVKDVAVDMQKNKIAITELRVDGGATQNEFMLRFQADLLDIPVVRSSIVESTAWGVAALAGLKVGIFKDLKELESKWLHDLKVEAAHSRSKEYEGWKKALAGAFAAAGKSMPHD